MKKQLSAPLVVAIIVGVVALVGFFLMKSNPSDNVQTGTKTGYDEKNMPAPPSFTVPPPPQGEGGPSGATSVPPPADARPPQGR